MKKLLATLLALSLILGSLFTGMVSVAAATFTPVVSEDTEHYGLVPYPIETYAAVGNYKGRGNQLADYEYASIDKVGVDGTNGLKIEGEGKDTASYIRLGTAINFLDPAIKYVLEFQVKTTVNLDETDEGYFEYGVSSAWKDENSEVHSFEEADVWETISYTFTPSADDESGDTGWCHVMLMYNIPVGETLYFDNFALYTVTETKDESGNVTASTIDRDVNCFDRVYSDGKYLMKEFVGTNRGSFDWYEGGKVIETTTEGTVVPIAKADIPTTNKATDIPSATKYDSIISINAGDGVNGTAGMKIGPTGKKVSPRLGLGAEGEHYGTGATFFTKDTTYILSFKAKKQGTVTDFSFEWNKSGSWTTSKIIAVDLTDEWVEYRAEITITRIESYLSGSNYRGGHNNLYLNCNVAANSYLYIDDIQFCKKGNNSFNALYWGDFDKYILNDVDNTVLEGVTYEPYPLYYSTASTYDDVAAVNPVKDTAGNAVTDGYLSVSELGEGVRGSYAMVLNGAGAEIENSPVIGQYTMVLGKKYQVSFKAKVSDNAVLTKFNVGIKKKWSWNGDTEATNNNILKYNAGIDLGLTMADSNGIADITTDWQKFTFTVDIRNGSDEAYRYLYLNYNLNKDAKLYIDDVEIYEVGGDGLNLFTQGSFGRIKSVDAIDAGDEIGLYSAKWLDEWDYYEGETLVNDYNFDANAMPSSLALSGKHVLAAGGIFDNSKPVNGRVGFEMTGIAPGKTYKVAFSLMLVGEVTNLVVRLTDGGSGSVNLVERKSGIAIGQGSKRYLEYGSELWQDYEFIFTSETDKIVNWPSFVFNMTGEAGSGFLLEDVSVQEVLPDGSLAGNQFVCEGFEIPEIPAADFSSNKFWGTDVFDLSFTSDLEFAIDVMGLSSTKNPDIYADVMREDSDFAFANTVVISNKALDVIRYEAEIANKLGKEIWLNADSFASEKGALTTGNWQVIITAAANIIQNIAVDNFQGFYFDEPHLHYASNDEFLTVTKFLRENFRKRVFSMNKHDACYENSSANVTMTADSHAYVTDVGYWNYTLSGIATRVAAFKGAYERLNNPGMRAWFACSLGSKLEYNDDGSYNTDSTDTEEKVISIFNTMLDGVKDIENFGGIMLYSVGDTNGYEEIKLGEDGKAEYDTYRNILLSLNAELDGEVIGVEGFVVNEDGIINISAGNSIADIISAYGAIYTNAQIKDGDTILGESDAVKTGLTVVVDTKIGTATLSAKIALENDVNCDADTNILDLVRLKKIAGGLEATAEQLAAAGSTVAEGIDADNLIDYRQFLMGE